MRIISLSTIPPRFHAIGPTLQSLLSQTGRIDQIRLYVPRRYRRFPAYDGAAPEVPGGITVVRTDDDLGPASKVLFAARDLQHTPARILFCDDDRLFSPTWAEKLFAEQDRRPGECVALIGKLLPRDESSRGGRLPKPKRASSSLDLPYRIERLRRRILSLATGVERPRPSRRLIRKAGYVDILQGWGGAVVRPDFFDDVAFAIPDVIWSVDDFWLSGMLERRNIPIWLPSGLHDPLGSDATDIESLQDSVSDGVLRDEANLRCIAYMRETFGIWS